MSLICFVNDTATTEIYTLSLHDALPIWQRPRFLYLPILAAAAPPLFMLPISRCGSAPLFILPFSRCGSAPLFILPGFLCGSALAFYTAYFLLRQRPAFYTARFSLRQRPCFLYCPFLGAAAPTLFIPPDWKSVVEGKSVDLGGRRLIKKKNIIYIHHFKP